MRSPVYSDDALARSDDFAQNTPKRWMGDARTSMWQSAMRHSRCAVKVATSWRWLASWVERGALQIERAGG